jgi:hypothetical protein
MCPSFILILSYDLLTRNRLIESFAFDYFEYLSNDYYGCSLQVCKKSRDVLKVVPIEN